MRGWRRALLGVLAAVGLQAQPLTIYTEVYPPYQYVGADGRPAGYAVELVRELQARTGHPEPIELVPWARGYGEAQSRPGVLLFTVARSPERESLFQWVGPISESSHTLYVRADAKLKARSLEDARRLRLIGVYKEDILDQLLTRAGFANLDRSPDQGVMVKKLMDGRIDALACASESIADIARAAGFDPKQLRPLLAFDKVQGYLAFSKGTPDTLVDDWARALDAAKRDGFFDRNYRAFFHAP